MPASPHFWIRFWRKLRPGKEAPSIASGAARTEAAACAQNDAATQRARDNVLERIANNAPVEETAASLAALLEEGIPGASALIAVLRDGFVDLITAAPGRDLFLLDIAASPLDGIQKMLPCWGPRFLVADVAEGADWRRYHAAARRYGIRSCWWQPVITGAGEMLGGIVIQLPVRRPPAKHESELLAFATRMAGIAVEQRNLIDELTFQAHYDSLTGLANRRLFREKLHEAVFAGQGRDSIVALLHINLDRFKLINDVLGHDVGDEILRETARRLKTCLRRGDVLARDAGDEFLVLMPDLETKEDVGMLLRRLEAVLKPSFNVEGHELHISASTGVSLFPGDASDSATLEKHADNALHRAKRCARGRALFFEPDMERYSATRLELETHLRRALHENQFRLHYQREVDVRTGALVGHEALLRWAHPRLGMVSPASFIPVAEETGLITTIGRWTLHTACAQAVQWQGAQPVRVAVNISAVQFDEPDLVEAVASALAESGLPPSLLEIELTESVLLQDMERARDRVEQLRALGVEVAIDDFGTGHSSLTYLQRLHATAVKIDRSFVAEITPERPNPPLVQSIIAMAHAMDMRTIAEGIENRHQYDALARMGCDVAQGFWIKQPVEANQLFESPLDVASLTNLAKGVGPSRQLAFVEAPPETAVRRL